MPLVQFKDKNKLKGKTVLLKNNGQQGVVKPLCILQHP